MRKHVIDALPALTGLAAALVDATLGWAGTVHWSGATSSLVLASGLALGRMVSLSLHKQLLVNSQQSAPVADAPSRQQSAAPSGDGVIRHGD
ncbi:MAG: hypothetical protein ACR2M3_19560 [Thermomicrobiales bacterium]